MGVGATQAQARSVSHCLDRRLGFSSVPMRVAALTAAVAAATLALSGCADSVYYQTRYAPTSSEEAYSASERMFWHEDTEVYALPANPPALVTGTTDGDDDHRARRDCKPPGQQFKPFQVATGNGEDSHHHSVIPTLQVATMGEDPAHGPRTGPASSLVGWHDETVPGAHDYREQPRVAGYEDRPKSVRGEGIDRRTPDPVAGVLDDEGWCPPRK